MNIAYTIGISHFFVDLHCYVFCFVLFCCVVNKDFLIPDSNDICVCLYEKKHSTADIIRHHSGHTHHLRFASIAQQASIVLF